MKILVVEDDDLLAQTLKFLLATYNYAVDTAADGQTALEMADAFEYDLILMDIVLPRYNGIDVCQELRTRGLQQPILLLTGQSATEQKAIALNAGADDYMVKPFDRKELVARVQALLRRGRSTHQPVLTWGNLALEPNSKRVSYHNHLLQLTPKEFAVLELFLRHQETVFSARAILDHAWDSLESPGEESVRVHIKELRQKLIRAGAPKDLIKTVYRMGYRLNPLYAAATMQIDPQQAAPQIAELRSVNDELRTILEQLQLTQNELLRKNRLLEQAQQTIAQEQQQLQTVQAVLEQQVADRTAELQQCRALLNRIYHGSVQPIFMITVTQAGDFRCMEGNRAALRLVNLSLPDLQSKTLEEVFGPELGLLVCQSCQRCLQGCSVTVNARVDFSDRLPGRAMHFVPLPNPAGKIDRIVGTLE